MSFLNSEEFNSTNDLPKSWADAKRLSVKYYISSKPCKRGNNHSNIRATNNRDCLECRKEKTKFNGSIERIKNWKANLSYKEKMVKTVKYRHTNKKYKEVFDLDVDKINFPEYCPILNIKLIYFSNPNRNADDIPNVDRIDNTKGYTLDNIQIISFKANRIKNFINNQHDVEF